MVLFACNVLQLSPGSKKVIEESPKYVTKSLTDVEWTFAQVHAGHCHVSSGS